MSPDVLPIRREHGYQVWTLTLPEARNPISGAPMVAAIQAAVADANADHAVRAVVITGAGTAFSSGGNIKDMRDRTGLFGGNPAQIRQGYRHGIQRITTAMYGCEIPTIAAVNGPAVGAGCDLALMCDIRIAATTAVFLESFIKVGIIPGDGGAWLLPRVVGPSRAAQMAFTGDPVDAQTALTWGLVSQVVPVEDLLDTAESLARRIVTSPAHVLRMTKQLLRTGAQQTLPDHLDLAAALQAIAQHTSDHAEAIDAMLEKRPPSYTGN